MKICFLISSLKGGGAEKVISMLANEFSNTNEVEIITWSNERSFYELANNIQIHSLNLMYEAKSGNNHILFNLKRVTVLIKKLQEIKPDILISFINSNNILAIISGKICSIPVIISERSQLFTNKISGTWFRLRKLLYRFADLLVLQTMAAFELTFKYHLQSKKTIIIPNPIMLNEEELYKKENVILFVGRLSSEKHVIDLLEAFAIINAKVNNYTLWIVGDGPEMVFLKKAADNLSLNEKVIFWGQQKSPEQFYKKAKIFVLPSVSEGFPNVLLEAMNYKNIVISSNCKSGPDEIVENGINGFLYDPGNVNSLANILFETVSNFSAYEHFSSKAAEKLKNYSLPLIAAKWYEGICSLVNANKK